MAVLFGLFLSLGVWQVHRRSWKLDLIRHVESAVAAPAIPAPGPAAWPDLTAARDAYRHVTATGTFDHAAETLVQANTDHGPGFWVLTPLRTRAGFTVLVNRGFVPPEWRDPATRAAGQIGDPATVTGLLRMTEPKGGLLRSNDPAADRWFSRDVAAIAEARGLGGPVAPYFIDADAAPNPGGYPVGGLTVLAFPNNHLLYAITWFSLALMVAAAFVYVARDEIRRRAAARRKR